MKTYDARVGDVARDLVRILCTPLRFNARATVDEAYAHPYTARHHPIMAAELYDILHMEYRDEIRDQLGHKGDNVYFRAPPLRSDEDG